MWICNQFMQILIILTFTLMSITSNAAPATNEAPQTTGAFISSEVKITKLNNKIDVILGAKGAWLMTSSVYIGGALYGSTQTTTGVDRKMGYLGGVLGYRLATDQAIHYSLDIIVGAGSFNNLPNNQSQDYFSIIEPGLSIVIELSENVEIGAGITYRLIKNTNQSTLQDNDLTGTSLSASINFGFFP